MLPNCLAGKSLGVQGNALASHKSDVPETFLNQGAIMQLHQKLFIVTEHNTKHGASCVPAFSF